MNEPHPRMVPATSAPETSSPAPPVYQEPPEQKIEFRDVMPTPPDLPMPDVPADPTLVELIAIDIKQDGRRATDYSHLLS